MYTREKNGHLIPLFLHPKKWKYGFCSLSETRQSGLVFTYLWKTFKVKATGFCGMLFFYSDVQKVMSCLLMDGRGSALSLVMHIFSKYLIDLDLWRKERSHLCISECKDESSLIFTSPWPLKLLTHNLSSSARHGHHTSGTEIQGDWAALSRQHDQHADRFALRRGHASVPRPPTHQHGHSAELGQTDAHEKSPAAHPQVRPTHATVLSKLPWLNVTVTMCVFMPAGLLLMRR